MRIVFLADCRIDGAFRASVCAVPDSLPDADYYVLNLESAVSEGRGNGPVKRHSIVGTYADLDAVVDAFGGRLVLNLENNHAGDAGQDALDALCAHLERRGVPFACAGTVADVPLGHGRRMGLAAVQFMPRAGLSTTQGEVEAARVLESVKPYDVAVMYIHWGEEYVFFPSPEQRELAGRLLRNGVDLLIGMHPHVVQGVECIHDSHVYYSLGNGIFSVPGTPECSRFGLALTFEWRDGRPYIAEVPFVTHEAGAFQIYDDKASWDRLRHDLLRFPETSLQWHAEASAPFFKNHLGSWGHLIREHGTPQVARMLKAFAGPLYLKMMTGRLCALGRHTRNEEIDDAIVEAVRNVNGETHGKET